jgi:hypothetical protein
MAIGNHAVFTQLKLARTIGRKCMPSRNLEGYFAIFLNFSPFFFFFFENKWK